MIDLTFKIVSLIMFIAGVVFQYILQTDHITGTVMMIFAVFIFLQAHIIAELRTIREKMDKKE